MYEIRPFPHEMNTYRHEFHFVFSDNRQVIEWINMSVFTCSSLSLYGWESVSVLQLACNDYAFETLNNFFYEIAYNCFEYLVNHSQNRKKEHSFI